VDSPGSGLGRVTGCDECGDEPSGSGATEIDYLRFLPFISFFFLILIPSPHYFSHIHIPSEHLLKSHCGNSSTASIRIPKKPDTVEP
jgi:hypothetical protein